jgi:hypothetical protein
MNRSLTRFAIGRSPMENHALIRRVTEAIGIDGLYRRGSYIRATRIGGGRDIQIHAGYTNGFLSEDEILRVAGDIERWPSARARETWGITHPVNGGQRGERGWAAGEKPDYGTCADCGMKFLAALTCSCN